MYVIYEKDYIDRLGNKIDNQVNIGDSDSVNGVLKLLEKHRGLKLSKRVIYKSIQKKEPIYNKYYIFKIKE
jgi:hypothetical protein